MPEKVVFVGEEARWAIPDLMVRNGNEVTGDGTRTEWVR
jgi:hypothetical protein